MPTNVDGNLSNRGASQDTGKGDPGVESSQDSTAQANSDGLSKGEEQKETKESEAEPAQVEDSTEGEGALPEADSDIGVGAAVAGAALADGVETQEAQADSPGEAKEQAETGSEQVSGAEQGEEPPANETHSEAPADEEEDGGIGVGAAVAGAALAGAAATGEAQADSAGEAEGTEGGESKGDSEEEEQGEQPTDETGPAAQEESDVAEDGAGPTGAAALGGLAGAAAPDPGLLQEEKRRRRLLFALLLLTVLLAGTGAVFWRYLKQPAPLPDLLPLPGSLNYAPHYLFSIYGVEKPVGVALAPQGDRIYISETGGSRLVKIFDRDGNLLGSFAPPRTRLAERSPVYLAVDDTGRVYVSDRLQHAVFVYDSEGNYQDMILSPALTLSEYVSSHVDGLPAGARPEYNRFEQAVHYQKPGESEQTLPAPGPSDWAPLGVRLDGSGNLLLTDVFAERHAVLEIPGDAISATSWQTFDPPVNAFGSYGQGSDQFMFPNAAVIDSLNRVYVTDGNNGRVSVWDRLGEFLFSFGQGAGEGALGLPRGAIIDTRNRLHVVDTVEQSVKVYDVSGSEPDFLFAFGDWGAGDGQFNFPNDIALDTTGRLYIADRENNRIQVWSY